MISCSKLSRLLDPFRARRRPKASLRPIRFLARRCWAIGAGASLVLTVLSFGPGAAAVPGPGGWGAGKGGSGEAIPPPSANANPATPDFGPNVVIFTPSMPQSQIQAELDQISTAQVPAQFGTGRWAIFFEPGTYGSATDPLIFQVGYYTEVAGLGVMPQDTVINGEILVLNQCSGGVCNGTDNFWRSLSNLTLNVVTPAPGTTPPGVLSPPSGDPYGTGCDTSAEIWAASQAMPIRRVIVNGNLVLQDYCSPTGYVSGGFIADSEITGKVDFFGQQQYLVRNSDIGGVSNSVWNMVFSGVNGAPATEFTGTGHQYTTLPESPVSEEEPFLYLDSSGNWEVFLPSLEQDSVGPSWITGTKAGTSLPISSFFIANPSTPVSEINLAVASGENLILTPGIYDLPAPIMITRPNTVVVGLGFATLVPEDATPALVVLPNEGVRLSGLIVDAGAMRSAVLVSVGSPGQPFQSQSDPDTIQDVFFRIGGAEAGQATVSLLDQAAHSIIDDVWAWRADHGNPGTVGWTTNVADTGVVVTGNDVVAYGLAVEHYQRYEVIWSGNGGTDIFFQNELPYDPPSQSAWMAIPHQDGYPAFLVTPNVRSFQGYGMGVYAVFIDTSATIEEEEAFQAPIRPDVVFHDIFSLYIAGTGTIQTVIDGYGGSASSANADSPVDVVIYPPTS